MSVIPFIEGNRVLEIGHGPGHLQRALLSWGLVAVGIDESSQMGRLAKRNLAGRSSLRASRQPSVVPPPDPQFDYTHINLARGLAQYLPFSSEAFDTIIATFPTEYITDVNTLVEVKRCLSQGGKFVVLPVAWPKSRVLDWLFKVTHQAPQEALEIVKSKLRRPFVRAGFETEVRTLDVRSGILLIVLARKPLH